MKLCIAFFKKKVFFTFFLDGGLRSIRKSTTFKHGVELDSLISILKELFNSFLLAVFLEYRFSLIPEAFNRHLAGALLAREVEIEDFSYLIPAAWIILKSASMY